MKDNQTYKEERQPQVEAEKIRQYKETHNDHRP